MQLVSTDTLLAARYQIDRLQHLVHRNAGVLEYRANLHRELLLAVVTAPEANADTLLRVRLHLRDAQFGS